MKHVSGHHKKEKRIEPKAILAAMRRWVRHASRGDRLPYYHGFLLKDRGSADQFMDVVAVADLAAAYAGAGLVSLVQRRLGPGRYEYLMERTAGVDA